MFHYARRISVLDKLTRDTSKLDRIGEGVSAAYQCLYRKLTNHFQEL